MSTIVRKYLLGKQHMYCDLCICSFSAVGSLYVHRMARLDSSPTSLLNPRSPRIISLERGRQEEHRPSQAARHWRLVASKVLHKTRAGKHYTDHIGITEREHMSNVDCFDGATMRGQSKEEEKTEDSEEESDLLTISPAVDDRLKDEGRN